MSSCGQTGRGKLVVILLLVGLLAVGGFLAYGRTQLEPASATHGKPYMVTVHPGEGVQTLADTLANDGVIRSSWWFGWYARLSGLEGNLRPGTYSVDSGMGASALVATFRGSGPTATRVTLAEGLTADQMAAKLERSNTGITASDYLAAEQNWQSDLSSYVGRSHFSTLEGLLFPDTYDVPAGSSAEDMIRLQLGAFARKAQPLLATPAPNLDAYQTVILASIVEREAPFAADRPLVAGVLSHRLAIGMNLQVDPAVLYGLHVTGRSPTAAELAEDTPYNTYVHPGLPPTPISNPGAASLEAAARPTTTDYLFYVSDQCGHIHFSMTFAEHQQQAAQYAQAPCS